jgi:hypothetical protein
MTTTKGGRPIKLSSGVATAILDAISCHIPYRIAAESNGIAERTLFYWIKRGCQDMDQGVNSAFSEFLQSLRKIESDKIMSYLSLIRSNTKGHKGCQWILEHVFWRYFSAHAQHIELNERIERLETDVKKTNLNNY